MANKVCPKCGTEMEESANFCTNCGYQFTDTKIKDRKFSFRKKGIILSIIGALVIGMILSFIINKKQILNTQSSVPTENKETEKQEVVEEIKEEEEEKEKETEEIFTYWALADKVELSQQEVTISLSNKNKVEAEVHPNTIKTEKARYYFTVTENKEDSDDYHTYYEIDQVEKVELDLANVDYSLFKTDIEEYADSQSLEYEIERFDSSVQYTFFEPNIEEISNDILLEDSYQTILQKVDYAADDNERYEDYLIFMDEYELLPEEEN